MSQLRSSNMEATRIHCRNIQPVWEGAFVQIHGKVYVFSPYITSPLAENVLRSSTPSLIEIHTRFEIEAFAARASSLTTLKQLVCAGYQLFEVPRLHAKIVSQPSVFATIGSQNLTQNGTRNREATVELRDSRIMNDLQRQTARWIKVRKPITLERIEAAESLIVPLEREFQRVLRACRRADRRTILLEYQRELNRRLAKFDDGNGVPQQLCKNVAWNSTEWYRNLQFVRSRRDANHMRKGPYGWEIPLGANRFGVELAIRLCFNELKRMFPPDKVRTFQLAQHEVATLRKLVQAAVIAHDDRPYHASYPVADDGRIWFGTHAVNSAQVVAAILHFSGFEQ